MTKSLNLKSMAENSVHGSSMRPPDFDGNVSPALNSLRMNIDRVPSAGPASELTRALPPLCWHVKQEMILTTGSDNARARAEASFKKKERAKDAANAMTEYQANSRRVREKTARLRALRLAKEAADKNRGSG
jgi:hypothetical protein